PRVKKEKVSGLFLTISLCIVKIDCRCSSLIEVNTQWGKNVFQMIGLKCDWFKGVRPVKVRGISKVERATGKN
ncbi:hypothetical protein, partial [Vibrio kanaloae]|uniref:hypothetical protein n=1 Tax=Vibrio kanaloae TaxID=170673 RepID=UPI0019CFBA33